MSISHFRDIRDGVTKLPLVDKDRRLWVHNFTALDFNGNPCGDMFLRLAYFALASGDR